MLRSLFHSVINDSGVESIFVMIYVRSYIFIRQSTYFGQINIFFKGFCHFGMFSASFRQFWLGIKHVFPCFCHSLGKIWFLLARFQPCPLVCAPFTLISASSCFKDKILICSLMSYLVSRVNKLFKNTYS